MDDILALENILTEGTGLISGPWRLSVWKKYGSPVHYVFSEEHNNNGSCPGEKDISTLARQVLRATDTVHVFIEHFIHATSIKNTSLDESVCTKSKEKAILNNMRNCLEVLRINNPSESHRIHFVDPRTDIVAILPDGKVFEAITMYVEDLIKKKKFDGALMTLYEAFIHPLLSIFPDKLEMTGRLTGQMERSRGVMDVEQREFFDSIWRRDVVQRISLLTELFRDIQKNKGYDRVEELMKVYRDMTNKFLDTWLLAKVFSAEHNGMTASMIYLGSLHSLNFETYLEQLGYSRTKLYENTNLTSCLNLRP